MYKLKGIILNKQTKKSVIGKEVFSAAVRERIIKDIMVDVASLKKFRLWLRNSVAEEKLKKLFASERLRQLENHYFSARWKRENTLDNFIRKVNGEKEIVNRLKELFGRFSESKNDEEAVFGMMMLSDKVAQQKEKLDSITLELDSKLASNYGQAEDIVATAYALDIELENYLTQIADVISKGDGKSTKFAVAFFYLRTKCEEYRESKKELLKKLDMIIEKLLKRCAALEQRNIKEAIDYIALQEVIDRAEESLKLTGKSFDYLAMSRIALLLAQLRELLKRKRKYPSWMFNRMAEGLLGELRAENNHLLSEMLEMELIKEFFGSEVLNLANQANGHKAKTQERVNSGSASREVQNDYI